MKHNTPTLSRALRRAGQTAACIAALAGTLTAASSAEASETVCEGDYQIEKNADWSAIADCTEITGNLEVTNVTHFLGASALRKVGGLLKLQGTYAQTTRGFGKLESTGDLVISFNDTLKWAIFPKLTTSGTVYVLQNDNMTYAIFPKLETNSYELGIGGAGIFYNESLTYLDFRKLESSGDIRLIHNPSLTHTRFDQLISVKNNVELDGNDALSQVNFPKLTTVDNSLFIWHNAALTELTAPQLEVVGNHFGVFNTQLTELSCPQLGSVGGSLLIGLNDDLVDLSFPQLETVEGNLLVSANGSLAELDALHGVTLTWGQLYIANNPNISDCEVLDLWQNISFGNEDYDVMPVTEEEAIACYS